MKKIILFGIGKNGKTVVDTYQEYGGCFELLAVADNGSSLKAYRSIPVIKPEEMADWAYDEIWITTIYYREIKAQLTAELGIAPDKIRYVEYPMMFLEPQIYDRYREEIAGRKKCDHDEMQAVVDYVAHNGVRMYCAPFYDAYMERDMPVYYDEAYQMYYGIYLERRMYLSKKYDTEKKAQTYLRYACMEQDERSPHCYLSEHFKVEKGETGIDIGAAEGIFALRVIEDVGHIYLIEADSDWCEALAATFREYADRVTIIRGFVSDTAENGQLVLDQLFAEKQIDFIKMDIEGTELSALRGAKRLLENNMPKLAVCTYHRAKDSEKIAAWLSEQGKYTLWDSPGYVICQGEWELLNLQEVDFRRALLWAKPKENMKKLAVCIPNYNRPAKLLRLLEHLAEQIAADHLSERVELCVTDDCSSEKPDEVIASIRRNYPSVSLRYFVNERNRGMDYNFLHCVMLANGQYCWIIGNDDLPEENALATILHLLDKKEREIDVLVCPFDLYDEDDNVRGTMNPLSGDVEKTLYFDTSNKQEYDRLIDRMTDGNAIFCFLSNVIFKKSNWISHGNRFADKMDTIFIQMYMNLQTLREGAVYAYTPVKLIRNYGDDVINATFEREYKVLVGLNGVIDYFFSGAAHQKMQRCVVEPRINGRMWALPDDSPQKRPILEIESPKNEIYRRCFVRPEHRESYFANKDILLYGAGNLGRRAIVELQKYHPRSVSVFDADKKKAGTTLEGYAVMPADSLYAAYDAGESVVVVANQLSLTDIVTTLRANGVSRIAVIN